MRAYILASALILSAEAAHASAPRYLVCHEEERPPRPDPTAQPKPTVEDWVPLPRRRPPSLELARLEIYDVAESDPMPSRRVVAGRSKPPPREPALVVLEGRNDWRCIGVPRGTPGIGRVISAPAGSRFHGHPYLESWRQDNLQAAGELALQSVKPLVRRELERPIPQGIEPWQRGELERTKHHAARALADLGDASAAPNVLAFLRTLEKDGFNLWRDTLDTLPRLDPALADSYAIELFERALHRPALHRENAQLFTDLLKLIPSSGSRALPVLQKITAHVTKDGVGLPHGSGGCDILAARLRLGDAALQRELRAELNTASLDTQRAVECYSTLMPALYPGRDAAELDVLMYRVRYEEILSYLESTRTAGATPERARLLAWLRKRSNEPDVGGDRSRRDYLPDRHAMHLAALATLGDAAAKRQLSALLADPNDDGTAPWIGAYWALRFELDDAANLAVKRLLIARQQHMRRHSSESWPRRGGLVITEHGRIVEELARRNDARFALGLLDKDGFTRVLTTTWLARKRPAAACELVGDAARDAEPEAVDHAFWALSLLGNSCRAEMLGLVNDRSQPEAVRGMANEHLAMLRDASVPANNRQLSRDRSYAPTVSRARIIFAAPE